MTATLTEVDPPTTRTGSPATALTTRGLTKRFRGGQVAVDHLDLSVPNGSVFGFLGPNGSGKTTTIRMLLGLVTPTAGELTLLGAAMPQDARRVLPRVGTLVEGPAFHPYLSGQANLARLDAADADADPRTARTRTAAALDRVGLGNAATKKFRTYSLGMKQRLGLAAALLAPRDLLILDEPTNGLDPQGTREVRSLIRELNTEGVTVVLSSHLLSEIEQMCTDVAVMSVGKLVTAGPLDELLAQATATAQVLTPDGPLAAEVMSRLGLAGAATFGGAAPGASAELDGTAPAEVVRHLVHAGVAVDGFAVRRPTLEETFVALTGEGFDVAQ